MQLSFEWQNEMEFLLLTNHGIKQLTTPFDILLNEI